MALHRAMESPSWTRRKRLLVIGLPIFAVLLVAGVAIAAILLRAPILGGGTAGKLTLAWEAPANPTVTGPCTASMSSDKKLTVNFSNVVAGDSCSITGLKVDYAITRDVRVNAPKFVTAPGIAMTFSQSSGIQEGQVLTASPTGNMVAVPVALDLTFSEGLVVGQTYTADADAGITATEVAP